MNDHTLFTAFWNYLLKDEAHVSGAVLSAFSVMLAVYAHAKIARLTRRNYDLEKKYIDRILPWKREVERTYMRNTYRPKG